MAAAALVATANAQASVCPATVSSANGARLRASNLAQYSNYICTDAQVNDGSCICPGDVTIAITDLYELWGQVSQIKVRFKDLGTVRGNLRIVGALFNPDMATPVPSSVSGIQLIMQNLHTVEGNIIIETTSAVSQSTYRFNPSFPSLVNIGGDLIIRTTLTPGLSVNGTGGCSLTAAFSQETHQLIAPASTPRTLTIGGNIHVDAQCGEMRDINFRGLVVAGNVLVSASQGAFIQNFRIGHQYRGNARSYSPGWQEPAATTIGGNLTIATASLGHIIQPVLLASDGTFRIGNRFHVVNTGGRLSGIIAEPGVQLSAGLSMIIEESGVPDRESTGPLTDVAGIVNPLNFSLGTVEMDNSATNAEMITVRVDRRSVVVPGQFDDMTIAFGSASATAVANGRLEICYGYVKFDEYGRRPVGTTSNCLETRPPTLAPTSPPSPSPTPAPTTTSPTRPPTATPSMFPTFTGAVRRVDEGVLDDNSDDDKTSGGTIAIIVVVVLVFLIAVGVMAFYGMAYWKKADVERKSSELVGENFMVNPAFKSTTMMAGAPAASIATSHMRSSMTGANSPGATKYTQPADSKAPNAYLMPTQSKRPGGGAKPKKVAGPKKTAGPQQPKKTKTNAASLVYAAGPQQPKITKKEAASPVYTKPNKTKKAAGRAQAGKAAAAGPPKKKKAAKQQQNGFNPSFDNKNKAKSSSIVTDNGYLDANLNHDDGGYLDTNCDPNLQDGVYDSRTHPGFKANESGFGF